MAPTFRIHRPDVLASLPRPLDHTKGQYHIGEVYTQKAGSKKRKRLEVVVGVDGEAANIYHVPSSGLRTSYPIPPQESFTCAPHSIRYQDATSGRNNYTYLSTHDSTGAKVTLCRDVVDATGKTISTSTTQRVRHKSPIAYLFTSSSIDDTQDEVEKADKGDVLGLCKDGQVICFGAEDLNQKWSASSYNLCRDLLPATVAKFDVEFAFHASASEVLNGIFQGRQDAFSSFGRPIDPTSFNPDVLTLVIRSTSGDVTSRFLIVLGVLSSVSSQPLVQVHVTPLPSQEDIPADAASYQIHVQSGKLLQLAGTLLRTYNVTSAVPKLQGHLQVANNNSFLQLSEHSVLCLSTNSASVLNPTFQSMQASTPVQLPEGHEGQTPRLVTFLSKLDMAVAVVGNALVSIQIERPKAHAKEGLLIDSIGRGSLRTDRVPASLPEPTGNNTFAEYLPGTLSDAYLKESLADVEKADEHLQKQDMKSFEALLAYRFGVTVDQDANVQGAQTPDWSWLERAEQYPAVDRRWVLFAISRVFILETPVTETSVLRCVLPASNVLIYLISAGHLTTANLTAAFKGELANEGAKDIVADRLIQRLVGIDPTMELLLNYVTSTKLGEKEILLVIRAIMRSLDQQSRLLLPAPKEAKEEEYVQMEIDHLERELELAEYYLGDESNLRARALTTAFEKLANYSSVATVRALRQTFNPTEVLSLIHLLRVQLIGSAWTSRYVDETNLDRDDAGKAPPDGAIALIAELLSRCIDSIGPSGWLTNGTSAGDRADAADFITALRLEVSAALEGLNEAVYLDGILGEAVQYGKAAVVRGNVGARGQIVVKPVSLEVEISPRLPLGLVSKQVVSHLKVVSGGEVLERTSREKGHLLSQKVKEYSLERIAI
ncbi:Uncharacterized protein C8034_v003304 [Colletotrichum sidae]|uniref:Uncharacterized protein n=1 Tax=Colletotrichum sidae TaxID=1347389 RepID=A0A4V6QFM2_9PEZI|nr:Uncharacterized protein C8034_v003304 [Colletotrichum sidae]